MGHNANIYLDGFVLFTKEVYIVRQETLFQCPREMDRKPRPLKPLDSGDESDDGPRRPKAERPGNEDLLKRMRKVDPNQARRYRQRTGQ